MADDAVADELLASLGGRWSAAEELTRGDERVGSVRRRSDGSIFLPFDPDDAIIGLWSERYQCEGDRNLRRHAASLARGAYYRTRPLLNRSTQLRLRRAFSRVQARTAFPRWPVEPALHDLYDFLLAIVADVAGEPVPWIAPWPSGYAWALVLTHDVETATGYADIESLREIERRLGYRSSWNLVPKRYDVDDDVVRGLWNDGCEVGVHGVYHDGRDLASEAILRERLPTMQQYRLRWRADGFRAPATLRAWELMPKLGFDYDSSYPDTDPFEPKAGGCCSWLPFFNGDLVELPITLPQDHTLFAILDEKDESTWVGKSSLIRERGGMSLLITHPDYPAGGVLASAYEGYLRHFAGDETAWKPLPLEVSAWWRRRAETIPVRANGGWSASGAASDDAMVTFSEPRS